MFAMVIILMGGSLGRVARLADAHGSAPAPNTFRFRPKLFRSCTVCYLSIHSDEKPKN
jgi:hypothetical protein